MNFFKKLSVKLIPVFMLALCTVSGIWGISVQKTMKSFFKKVFCPFHKKT